MNTRSIRLLPLFSGLLLFLQSFIVISGGGVRLTGSGLGCPSWPECTPGSYIPIANQSEGVFHSSIEFGNRLLTFVLLFAAIATLVAVFGANRKDLRILAVGQILGILGQGVLGGITVLTKLNPITVASHFLLSMVLIAGALSLFTRARAPVRKNRPATFIIDVLSKLHLSLTALALILGTIVTGSGPHAGDWQAARFPIRIQDAVYAHGGAVVLLMALSIFYFLRKDIETLTKRWLGIFLLLAIAQGGIGYIQYIQGVPRLLVATHLLGACLVWIAAWRIWLTVRTTVKE